jgi:hypothetical protein
VLDAPLLIGACHGVLEARGVGGVACDGNVHALMPHDGNAFVDVVRAIAANLGLVAVRERLGADDFKLAGLVVVLGFHMRKAVHAGNDIARVLAGT